MFGVLLKLFIDAWAIFCVYKHYLNAPCEFSAAFGNRTHEHSFQMKFLENAQIEAYRVITYICYYAVFAHQNVLDLLILWSLRLIV